MRTLAVIPARLGSTRLPRKPLQLLAGLPLVVRVWERVMALGQFDAVVVATDSVEVEAAAAAHGARVVRTSERCQSGTERAAEVIRRHDEYDVVVNVQGDEPFVSLRAVLGATRMVTDANYPIGTAAVLASPAILGDPNVVKVVANDRRQAMYFSRAPIPFLRDPQDAELQRTQIYQHVGVYAYTRDTLMGWDTLPETPFEQIERLEQLRPLFAGIPIGVSLLDERVWPGIDTAEDLERANRVWTEFTTG